MPRPAPVPSPAADGPLGAGAREKDPHGDARAARRRTATRAGVRDAVAATLRALREAAGLSQEELGHRAGLHRTYVGGYERAERRLTIEAVGQVLAALGVTWSAFGAEMEHRVPRTPVHRRRR